MPIPIDEAIAAAEAREKSTGVMFLRNYQTWAAVPAWGKELHGELLLKTEALRTAKARGATHTDEGE